MDLIDGGVHQKVCDDYPFKECGVFNAGLRIDDQGCRKGAAY